MLAWTIYASFLGALAVLLLPAKAVREVRLVALGSAITGFIIGFYGVIDFGGGPIYETIVKERWIAPLGIDYSLAVDGISATLVLLTGLAASE